MSFDYNHKFWVATKKDIDALVKRQNVLKKKEPISNPAITYKLFSELYVLYVELVNKLSYVYNFTFQVQKRAVVRPLMEAAAQRLQQLKNELKNLELSEYVYVDKALIARKLTPYDLIIWRSPQFLYRRPPDIQNILYENKLFLNEQQEAEEAEKEKMKVIDAVILIQAHERARQARVYKSNIDYDKKNLKVFIRDKATYKFTFKPDQIMSIPVKRTIFSGNFIRPLEECKDMLEAENIEKKPSISSLEKRTQEELTRKRREAAALTIQRMWRGYKDRKLFKKRILFKQDLYSMRTIRKLKRPNDYHEALVQTYKNELLKQKLDEDYIQLIQDEKTRLFQERSPWLMEDISDHIRAWFKEFYDKVGEFHPYPDAIKSGTVLVLIDETYSPEEFREKVKEMNLSKEEKKKRAEKAKLQKKKEKEKLKKEKMKEAKRRKKMKDAGIYDIADDLTRNKQVEMIEKTIKQYSIDWRMVDEYLNKDHSAIKDWVTQDELVILHKELRALVDEYMRVEFEMLRKAHCADLGKKYKPQKQKKGKKKGKKGKKKKKVKDMTEDRTLQSLYEELKDCGIIEKYNQRTFEEFIADFNFVADNTRDEDNLTTIGAAKGDIKLVVQDFMFGMGEFTVEKPKSLLLVGPMNSGKKLLCNIIAFEMDAVFMNLSPEKTYIFSDNMNYFYHIILKVAKAFQPTILYIQDVHRVFWKKVPPDQQEIMPRLLQNLTKKILKPIKKDDKIMLLATTDAPWAAKPKMKKAFQKVILIPKCDYGSSFLLWLELLAQNLGEKRFDDYVISSLAKVLQSYNSGDITNNISSILTVQRKLDMRINELSPHEFVEHFLGPEVPTLPPDDKIMEKYNKFFQKSNKLCKARRKFFKKKEEKNKKKK